MVVQIASPRPSQQVKSFLHLKVESDDDDLASINESATKRHNKKHVQHDLKFKLKL